MSKRDTNRRKLAAKLASQGYTKSARAIIKRDTDTKLVVLEINNTNPNNDRR